MSAPLATDHLRLGMTLPLQRTNARSSEHGPEETGGPSLAFDAHFQRAEREIRAHVVEGERPSSAELDTQIDEGTLPDAGEAKRQKPEEPTLHEMSAPVESVEMQLESEPFLSTSLAAVEIVRDGVIGHSIGSLVQEASDDRADTPDKVSSSESTRIVSGLTGGDALYVPHAVNRGAASTRSDVAGGQTLTPRSGVFEPERNPIDPGQLLSRYVDTEQGDQGAETRRQDAGRAGGKSVQDGEDVLAKLRVSPSGRIQESVTIEGRYALLKDHSFPFASGRTRLAAHEFASAPSTDSDVNVGKALLGPVPSSMQPAEPSPLLTKLQVSGRGSPSQAPGFGTEITPEDFVAMPFSDPRQAFAPTTSVIQQSNLHRADVPQLIAHQIAVATYQSGDGKPSIELLLTPEELGRVRLKLTSNEGVMTVNVAADRPETLDLMRRHIDTLARAMHEIGFERAQFSFDRTGQGATDRSPTKPHQDREVKDARNLTVSIESVTITPVARRMTTGERLNILI